MTEVERFAARLSDAELRALSADPELFVAPEADAMFIRQQIRTGKRTAHYAVFSLAGWTQYLNNTSLTTEPHTRSATCLQVVGNVCWKTNTAYAQRRLTQATWLSAGSISVLALTVLLAVWRRVRARRREQKNRLLVLQTLTHEIRTPATTLQLSLESMRRSFDDLPAESQSNFLRICDASQRLQRVIEASKQYLRGHQDDRVVQYRKVLVPSVGQFVESIAESYDTAIQIELQGDDTEVKLDPYWTSTCIRNLIDNALQHGAEPVTIMIKPQGDELAITVQDAGDSPELSFREMTTAFVRRGGSDGLGLGLAVVAELVRSMGGSLRYESNPTRFTITLSKVRTTK